MPFVYGGAAPVFFPSCHVTRRIPSEEVSDPPSIILEPATAGTCFIRTSERHRGRRYTLGALGASGAARSWMFNSFDKSAKLLVSREPLGSIERLHITLVASPWLC
jgi:hypothetical protein